MLRNVPVRLNAVVRPSAPARRNVLVPPNAAERRWVEAVDHRSSAAAMADVPPPPLS